ncbi:hypothetical protein IFT54_12220 [Sphingomonas sp. CFBP 13714]|uniref:hypothetical protein n=1 Tax=Sphingomonas sp. CFBP 13714 TaxID=2775308 RepID=UPI00177E320B|nr:hypothetical protein [Sphingomonas sp. CFBP 13714]MBD8700586.1 hypothetical protein [Sphingomonas sp. CFBP 13714]
MRFRKSEGLTESEAILAGLCERSFLALYTYPNLFKQPGKELVDLMVVFRSDILLFSDKSCAYPDTGDPLLDWRRWFARAIGKSAHQVRQAERWLRSQPGMIFLDPAASAPLPIGLPPPASVKVHRICVATGAADRCRRETGQPMLGIDLTVTDAEAPLRVGTVSEAGGFLQVFDAEVLELVLTELDTISDFVAYLDAKAALAAGGQFKGAPTEADLLAYYLHHGRTFPAATGDFVLQHNLWRQVAAQPAFIEGRRLNREHRTWDRLIEYITRQFLAGQLEFGNELTMDDYERVVRIMAGESRFYRQILSQSIEERAARDAGEWIGSLLPSEHPDIQYVLLIGPGASRDDYAEYRAHRSRELVLRCHAAKSARPAARYIVGIGVDAAAQRGSSEDLVYLDTAGWTEDDMARANAIRGDLGYFVEGSMVVQPRNVEEYPGAGR